MTGEFKLYKDNPRFVLGFHGCDEKVAKLLLGKENPTFKQSNNKYDWLGNGMYFWENDPNRALDYVKEAQRRESSKYRNPTVVGAVLDLGHCFNLTENRYKNLLKYTYDIYVNFCNEEGIKIPKNKNVENDHDRLFRKLDRAVIEFFHLLNDIFIDADRKKIDCTSFAHTEEEAVLISAISKEKFDSVRAMFVEGKKIYKNAGFNEKTHVQIAIRNPDMIKGYFRPICKHKKI